MLIEGTDGLKKIPAVFDKKARLFPRDDKGAGPRILGRHQGTQRAGQVTILPIPRTVNE
jgi:hypothetical protein